MALKDLLVHLDQGKRAFDRLRLAADLAARHDSRLAALYIREMSPAQLHAQSATELGLGSFRAVHRANQRIEQSIEEAGNRLHAELQTLARERHIQVEWRCLDGVGSEIAPQQARVADLCIVSQDLASTNNAVEYTFSVVNPESYRARAAALSVDHMVEHLECHGATVAAIALTDIPTSGIADAIQSQARRVGADLIVAGAFGHPKLWEKLLGGVTRDLLGGMQLPILMSY